MSVFCRHSCGTLHSECLFWFGSQGYLFPVFLRTEPSAQCRKNRQQMTAGGEMFVILLLSQTLVPSKAGRAGVWRRGLACRRGASQYPLSARPFGWQGLHPTLPPSLCAVGVVPWHKGGSSSVFSSHEAWS